MIPRGEIAEGVRKPMRQERAGAWAPAGRPISSTPVAMAATNDRRSAAEPPVGVEALVIGVAFSPVVE